MGGSSHCLQLRARPFSGNLHLPPKTRQPSTPVSEPAVSTSRSSRRHFFSGLFSPRSSTGQARVLPGALCAVGRGRWLWWAVRWARPCASPCRGLSAVPYRQLGAHGGLKLGVRRPGRQSGEYGPSRRVGTRIGQPPGLGGESLDKEQSAKRAWVMALLRVWTPASGAEN